MLILTEPFEQWRDLKNDLTNYRLNSSKLFDRYDTASQFFDRQTTFLGVIGGYPAKDCFL